MDIVYFGTPDFALPGLKRLLGDGHQIVAVYTQPPRRAGRGKQYRPSPVQELAEIHHLEIRTPVHLRKQTIHEGFSALKPDLAVVAAYGLILPPAILEAPRWGCLNIHASLLPRWRGAAPIQRAILAGDHETGVTIMQMDSGLDTGAIRHSQSIPLTGTETAGILHDRLAALGGELISKVVSGLETGDFPPRPQPRTGITYADKIDKQEAHLDWSLPATRLVRQIRAFAPYPGAWCEVIRPEGVQRLKILQAEALPTPPPAPPGTLIDKGHNVACGQGVLRILRIQRAGKQPVSHGEFLRGWPLPPGTRLG